ncbi:MAG: ABC transporter ATP-binding protein [Lautropia sp.]
MALLRLQGLSRAFGGVRAVDGVDLQVARGSIHGLIGPNGAGKTTAFNLISGLMPASQGAIFLEDLDITHDPAHVRVRKGICRTFQTPRLFEDMSAIETVMTGRHIHGRIGFLGSMLRFGAKNAEERDAHHRAMALLDRVGLGRESETLARNLSYGHRRVLEIARALAAEPRLLLLDEVTAGLNPIETKQVAQLIRGIVAEGVTVVLVEHDMRFVMSLCSEITVLNFGQVIATGNPDEITSNPEVVAAYLGRSKGAPTFRRRRAAEQHDG